MHHEIEGKRFYSSINIYITSLTTIDQMPPKSLAKTNNLATPRALTILPKICLATT
jgi:hypothetical protein